MKNHEKPWKTMKNHEKLWKTPVLRMFLTLDPSADRRIHVSSIHHSAVLLKRAWSCWSIVDLALNLRWNAHESATFHRSIIFQTFSRHLPDLIFGSPTGSILNPLGISDRISRPDFAVTLQTKLWRWAAIFSHGLSSEESSYWLSNWWYTYCTPLKNMKVSWGYYSQYMEK